MLRSSNHLVFVSYLKSRLQGLDISRKKETRKGPLGFHLIGLLQIKEAKTSL